MYVLKGGILLLLEMEFVSLVLAMYDRRNLRKAIMA